MPRRGRATTRGRRLLAHRDAGPRVGVEVLRRHRLDLARGYLADEIGILLRIVIAEPRRLEIGEPGRDLIRALRAEIPAREELVGRSLEVRLRDRLPEEVAEITEHPRRSHREIRRSHAHLVLR